MGFKKVQGRIIDIRYCKRMLISLLIINSILLFNLNNINRKFIESKNQINPLDSNDNIINSKNMPFSSQNTIEIDGNIDLISFPGIRGTGIQSDPFIIENLTIDLESPEPVFILKNTDAYLTIRNCTFILSNIEQESFGVLFEKVKNVVFYNNTLQNLLEAIRCEDSTNITIFFNEISDCDFGIMCESSTNITITNNSLQNNYGNIEIYNTNISRVINNTVLGSLDNYGTGIFLSNSYTSNISMNTLAGNGISIALSNEKTKIQNLEIALSIKIENSNLLNNKPIYSYSNNDNLIASNFTNAGQIILINCNTSMIEDKSFSNVSNSIQLLFSNENYIRNCSFNDIHSVGIGLYYSHDNIIYNNNLKSTEFYGIYLLRSNYNNITHNSMIAECDFPLTLEYSNYNNITFNKINKNCYYQIYLLYSNYNTVSGNEACVTEENCEINYIEDDICKRSIAWLIAIFILIPTIVLIVLGTIIIKKIRDKDKN